MILTWDFFSYSTQHKINLLLFKYMRIHKYIDNLPIFSVITQKKNTLKNLTFKYNIILFDIKLNIF